jgi:hypothetical protein
MQVTMPLTTDECQGSMPVKKFVSGKQSSEKFGVAAEALFVLASNHAN